MGFLLTLIYIFLTIFSPDQFGEQWADYHVLIYLAIVTFIFSLPEIIRRRHLLSSVQSYLLLGFTLAVAISKVANGWPGGAIVAWREFLPSVGAFFFIIANVTTIRRLKILTLTIVGSCFAVVVEAMCGYYAGFRGGTFVLTQALYSAAENFTGQINRLRGAGYLSDPNDLAQVILVALPLLFLAWRRGQSRSNWLTVLMPSAVLLWAVYLTHSRGALLALAVLCLMAVRKRIGNTTSVVLTAGMVFGLLAVNFTGGRGISADAGADRLWSWSSGLEMFKSAPVFGIGYGNYTNFYDITAHNSFVLCLAELGLVGSLLWVALIVTTVMDLNGIIKVQEAQSNQSISAEETDSGTNPAALRHLSRPAEDPPVKPAVTPFWKIDIGDSAESAASSQVPGQWILAIRMALISFLTTSWFLSRTYQTPMYLVLGLATSAILLQRNVGESPVRKNWIFTTLAVEATTIALVYLVVRLRF